VCGQALAFDFLPREIADYRAKFPLVQFDVQVRDHERAMAALAAYEVDLVLVFRPPFLPNFAAQGLGRLLILAAVCASVTACCAAPPSNSAQSH